MAEMNDIRPGERVVSRREVMARMGWSSTTLWRRIKDGFFPPSFPTGPQAVGWLESDLEEAIARMAAQRKPITREREAEAESG